MHEEISSRERAGGPLGTPPSPQMGTRRPRRRLLGAATFPPPRRAACASSWHLPTLPQHVLGASGRNRQPALPSFLMQFANGCEDTAKPERDWEPEPLRLPRCRRDACCREAAQRCGAGEPAEPGLARSALRCKSPWQISLRILTGWGWRKRPPRSPGERWLTWWQAQG